MRGVDIIPRCFHAFVILLMVVFGRHILLIFVAIGAVNWSTRIVRGQTLRKNMDSSPRVSAAGPSLDHPNILWRGHIHVT
jgi:oligopeptide transport system permease protein